MIVAALAVAVEAVAVLLRHVKAITMTHTPIK
jgi:hypothetical protein